MIRKATADPGPAPRAQSPSAEGWPPICTPGPLHLPPPTALRWHLLHILDLPLPVGLPRGPPLSPAPSHLMCGGLLHASLPCGGSSLGTGTSSVPGCSLARGPDSQTRKSHPQPGPDHHPAV